MTDLTALTASLVSKFDAAKLSRGKILAVILFGLVIRRSLTKKSTLLISDLKHVGRVEGETQSHEVEFDVVIVGGGTAGCVLASRLSEDPSISVLVLESGGSGLTNINTRIPVGFGSIMGTDLCWNYYTEPQTALTGKNSKYWVQGKMLGGSSSMNAMMFHCGCPEDYDQWARENSDAGSEIWSYNRLKKYFLKFEKFVPSKKFPLVDVSLRGSDGPVEVGYFGYFSQIAADFIRSCVKVGIPHVHDVNTSVGTLGVTRIMTYINSRGRRVSAETAYLTPKVLSRPNLKVAIHAQVTRILFDKTNGTTRAVGVEFARTRGGPRFHARARKEVVVSAGAIHTPQLLMLSGVGPAEQLASHSIPVVHDLPGVGSHLQDHISINLAYRDKSKTALDFKTKKSIGQLGLMWQLMRWRLFGTGPMTDNVGEAVAFVRSTDPLLFLARETPQLLEDSTSGPGAPDLELLVAPMAYRAHGTEEVPPGYLLSLHAVLLRPTSSGTITLKSANPFQSVSIDPRYLSTEHDLNVLIRGLKLVLRVSRTRPLYDFLDDTDKDVLLDHDVYKLNDAELTKFIKQRAENLSHPCSTARMAPLKERGVVDPYLRVHGIPNMRIVDASVFPTIVSGHTAATVYAIAEQAADLVKAAVGRKLVNV